MLEFTLVELIVLELMDDKLRKLIFKTDTFIVLAFMVEEFMTDEFIVDTLILLTLI